jgi:hypothetical protein
VIIFGWGHTKEKDFGETFPIHCPNCDNDVFLSLVQFKKSFSLFFIPILPYKTEYYLLCPTCSRGRELKQTKIDVAKEMNQFTLKYMRDEIEDDEYDKRMKKYEKILFEDESEE